MPFLHTRQHLAERLQQSYEELAPHVAFLVQNRYLHWKAADVFKISPKGLRATHNRLQRAGYTLEVLPASSHPMDVLRTGVSVLGCTLPEKESHDVGGARDIADRLIGSLGSMLTYWYQFSPAGERI